MMALIDLEDLMMISTFCWQSYEDYVNLKNIIGLFEDESYEDQYESDEDHMTPMKINHIKCIIITGICRHAMLIAPADNCN